MKSASSISPLRFGAWHALALALGLVCVTSTSGCLSKPALVKETFSIHGPIPAAPASKGAPLGSLAIRQFTVAPSLENRSFLYRVSDEAFERDPYAELLVPPSRVLPDALRAHLRQTGIFQAVLEFGSAVPPRFIAEINVTEFFGDFRQPEKPKAVLTLRFNVIDATNPGASEPWFEKEITRGIDLQSRTASALAAGWNQALAEIAQEFAAGLRLQASPKAPANATSRP